MQTTAQTKFGPVRGVAKDGVVSFRGIPFGASTAGPNRWQAPQPFDGPGGELDATEFGPGAPQNAAGLEAMLGPGEGANSEDCLRLNVFTPAADDRARPVMVWIHGGAFETGSGHVPWYNGTALAARGAVVVTINYRLGALGFLHLAGLGLGDVFPDAANVGILDQVAALRWVREHIASFGGDPGNVTVFGESAGAMSIGTLLGVPEARGLFHKAIMQSGAAEHLHTPEQATRVAEAFVQAAGTGADAERLAALTLDEVLAAQAKSGALGTGANLQLAWEPMVDGVHVPESPVNQVAAGAIADVPVLIGTTLEEMRLFQMLLPGLGDLDDAALARQLAAALGGDDAPAAAERALEVYRDRLGSEASTSDVWVAAQTDAVFRMPAVRLATRQSVHQPNTYMYLFTYQSPAFGGALGSSHALEIPFVFDLLDAGGVAMFAGPIEGRHRSLAKAMADAWVAFAHHGRPAAAGLPDWPAYDAATRATMRLDVDICEVVDDPMADERQLWAP